jgi:hypothetical protein
MARFWMITAEIQYRVGHVTRLPTFRDCALDRQELTIEVDASPAQCKDLAASKSGVH